MENVEEFRVLATDDYLDAAHKIYHFFRINQSCTIRGMVIGADDEPYPKGELVIKELEAMDLYYNVGTDNRRKRVKPPNSIGDYVAQKMFVWEKRIQDGRPIFMIWRKQ